MISATHSGAAFSSRTSLPAGAEQGRFADLFAILLVLANAGYPLFGILTTILMPGETTINYSFRGIVVGLSVIAAAYSLLFTKRKRFSFIIFIFFCIYSYRLYYDTFIDYLTDADIASEYFFGTVLIPVIAIGLGAWAFNDRRYAFWAFVISSVESLAILIVTVILPSAVETGAEEQGRLSFDALNPITIGYTGVLTILSAVYLFPRSSPQVRVVLAAMMAVGTYVVILSGSRGPLVSAIACLTFLAAVRGRVVLLAFGAVISIYAGIFAADQDLAIISRLSIAGTAEDASSVERFDVMQLAIDEARASPIFGHAYAETTMMAYPHNLLVESALALGVVGLLLMAVIQVLMLRAAWKLGRQGQTFVAMLILVAFVNANLSASLWQSTDFWTAATLAMILPAVLRSRQPSLALARPPR